MGNLEPSFDRTRPDPEAMPLHAPAVRSHPAMKETKQE
jgi:hypothetical protein